MAKNRTDLLGDLGEQDFARWATIGGITANKSVLDRQGWDFILQMSDYSEIHPAVSSLDKLGPELSCKVQVKSTRSMKYSYDKINLKNWRRMITDSCPWFIAILIYEKQEVKDAFLVHIDANVIASVLARLREFPQADIEILHKKCMTITWTNADRIFRMITSPPSDGEWGLISVLKSAPSPVVPSLSTAG